MENCSVGFHLVQIAFPYNKTSKIMQTYGISLEIVKLEIIANQVVWKKSHTDKYCTTIIEAYEIGKNSDMDYIIAKSHTERINECENDSEEMKFKQTSLHLVDRAIEPSKRGS